MSPGSDYAAGPTGGHRRGHKHWDVRVHAADEPMAPEVLAQAMREVEAVTPCGLRVGAEAIAGAQSCA